jgi:hypothetical protein
MADRRERGRPRNDCRTVLLLVRRGFETTLLSGAVGIVSILFVSMLWDGRGSAVEQHAQQPAAGVGLTLEGDVALWTVSIKPDRTAHFEKVLTKLRDALSGSEKPERRRQAAGWRVMRIGKPLPDGNIAYVHIINPVVPGADYSVMQTLYDEFPEERQALYELYRGAFAQNLSLATGTVVLDMSKAE